MQIGGNVVNLKTSILEAAENSICEYTHATFVLGRAKRLLSYFQKKVLKSKLSPEAALIMQKLHVAEDIIAEMEQTALRTERFFDLTSGVFPHLGALQHCIDDLAAICIRRSFRMQERKETLDHLFVDINSKLSIGQSVQLRA